MSCTMHFWKFQWEHHSWRPRVSFAENVPTEETSMWGRPVNRQNVRCLKQEVCEACGKTRRSEYCLCDSARAEHCAIRLAWIEDSQNPLAER